MHRNPAISQLRILPAGGIALALGLAALGLAGRTEAADYNPGAVLRGAYGGDTEPRSAAIDWAGFYGGAHAGITSVKSDASPLRGPLVTGSGAPAAIQSTVSSMVSFRETQRTGLSYGAFIGINWQWDDVVLGVEADYSHGNIRVGERVSNTATVASGGFNYTINTTSDSRARIRDWGTLRGRAGWAVGMFMPYLTAGIAVGNFDGRGSLSGTWTSDQPAAGTLSSVAGSRGLAFGGVIGGGVDMQLIPNTFLRTEWQSILFASSYGGSGPRPETAIHVGRIAGGLKF